MELPYDDITYEAQVQDTEQSGSTTLKERIGNRIYVLEDSRKRKLADSEENTQDEDDDAEVTDADLTHRPNALLLQGPPISQLPTARVFAYATHFDAHPIGLEWVDDQTCVLVFPSRKHAVHAWDVLRRPGHTKDSSPSMQVEQGEDNVFAAPPLPLSLYPIEERINSALGAQKSAILKDTINIRWARSSDVKQPGARDKSEFYKKHGESAGKEGNPAFSQHKRRKYNDEDDWNARRKLDAEIEAFWREDESELDVTAGNKRKRPQDEETRRKLDEELDSFLAQGSEPETSSYEPEPEASGEHSLIGRTDQGSSQQTHRRRHPHETKTEGKNGHWKHRLEVRQELRLDYDDVGHGMRAWREGGDEGPRSGDNREPGKTLEDLDRELDEFLG